MRRRKAKKEELPPPPEPHTASTVSKFVNSPWLFLIWPYPLYKLLTLIYPGSSIMYTFFISLFVVLVVICVVVRTTFASPSDGSSTVSKSESFLAFQKNWLIVYFIVMGTYYFFTMRITLSKEPIGFRYNNQHLPFNNKRDHMSMLCMKLMASPKQVCIVLCLSLKIV